MLDTTTLPAELAGLAQTAAAAVVNGLGEQLPPTRILIASRIGLARIASRSAAAVAGGRVSWRHRVRHGLAYWQGARTGLACTMPAPDGVLVVVTRRALTDERLGDYLVHELVHAVQAGRPGRRAQQVEQLRQALGVAEPVDDFLYAEHLREQVEEGEAYRLQGELAGAVRPVEGQVVHRGQDVPHEPARAQ